MKYLNLPYLLFVLSIALLLSCNQEDDDGTSLPQNYIYDSCVPTKKEFINSSNGMIDRTQTFEYVDGRLSKVLKSDGTSQSYEYEGDLVSRIGFYTRQDVLQSYWSYAYNTNNQMTKMQYHIDLGGTYTLRREVDYTYENAVLKEAEMFYRGTDSKLVYYHSRAKLDSIEFYENDQLQRKEVYEWDGKNSEYVSLEIPIADHYLTPLPFPENATKILRKQYDTQGFLLHSGTSLCPVNAYNANNFPESIKCSSTPEYVFEYINCQ